MESPKYENNSVLPVKSEKVRGCKDLVEMLSKDFQMYSGSFDTESVILTMAYVESRGELAVGAENGFVIWFDVVGLKEIKKIECHKKSVVGLKISKSELFLLSASDDSYIILHNVASKSIVGLLELTPSAPETICFSEDEGFACIGCKDSIIYIWNLKTPGSPNKLLGHNNGIVTLLSLDSSSIISSSIDTTLKIWDLKTLKEKNTLEGHTSWINTFILSNNRDLIISGAGDNTVRIWKTKNLSKTDSLIGHKGEVYALAINNTDTILASGSQDKTVRVWNLKTKIIEYVQENHVSYISYVKIPKDSDLVISTSYNFISIDNFVDKRPEVSLEGHTKTNTNLLITQDGNRIISASNDKTVKIWNIDEKEDKVSLNEHSGSVSCLLVTNDNMYIVSGGWDCLIIVWKVKDKVLVHALKSHENYVCALDQTHDGRKVVSGSWDYTLKLWEVGSGILLNTFSGLLANVYHLKISYNSHFVACTSVDNVAKFWSLDSYIEIFSFTFADFTTNLQISRKNLAILSNLDGTLTIANCIENVIENEHKFLCGILNFSLSLDERKIIICLNDDTIRVWDFARFEEIGKLTNQTFEWPVIIKYLSNSTVLIVSNKTELKIFEIDILAEIGSRHMNSVITLATSDTSGAYCILGCKDGEILTWNVAEKRVEVIFKGHRDQIECMSFTESCRYLVSGSKDKTVKIWRFDKFIKEMDSKFEDNTMEYNGKQSILDFDFSKMEKSGFEGNQKLYPPLVYNGFRQRFVKKLIPISSDCKIILPAKINLPHLYCYLGYYEHLAAALRLGCQVRRDYFKNSPLHYAIIKDSQKCIDVLLEYMIQLSKNEKDYSKYFEYNYALREDMHKVLKLSSAFVPEYLESIFIVSKDKSLPNSLRCLIPPVIIFTSSTKILFNDFRNICISLNKGAKFETFVEFRTLPIEIDLTSGSKECLRLYKSLIFSKNQKVFKTKLIRTILDYKFKLFYYIIFCMSFISALNLILMLGCITTYNTSKIWNLGYLTINVLMIIHENLQIIYEGLKVYKRCIRNVSNLASAFLSILWTVFNLMNMDLTLVKWFMIITNFNKGLNIFKAFDATRFYIGLLIRAIRETYSFLLIFCYSTVAFGALYVASIPTDQLDSPFIMLWKVPYDLNFGVFNSNESMSIEYIYFVLATLINIVMMLNLLIAILGDSFDKFQIEASEIDYKQKLDSVLEIECLFIFFNSKKKYGFLQLCDYDSKEKENDEWGGKVKEIEVKIEKISKEMNGILRKNQVKNDEKFEMIDHKLNTILTLLQK